MYEPSRHYSTFTIRGMQFSDCAQAVGELKVGDKLNLASEFDNPFDSQAIAIYAGKTRLGYVPREMNEQLSTFMYYGYEAIFTCRVLAVDLTEHPSQQITVAIYIKDGRNK